MIGSFRNASIGSKMTILAVVAGASSLILSAVALLFYAYGAGLAAAEEDLQSTARLMAETSTAALTFNDAATASETLATLRAKEQVLSACLWSAPAGGSATLFAIYGDADRATACSTQEPVEGLREFEDVMETVVPVRLLDEQIGMLRVVESLQPLRTRLRTQVQITLAILIGSLLATLPLVRLIQRVITDPIQNLASIAVEVSTSRNYSLRATRHGNDEIGQLSDAFNEMLSITERSNLETEEARLRLATQVEETQTANADLGLAMDQLQQTQEQLVQHEKMASLGGLVAGVAHEINTPVGVGVTAASTLEGHAIALREKYDEGNLKKSELEQFIQMAAESSRIILSNLKRAADLVHSFKQVAVDQSSSERRQFDLKEYVDEVLISLTPKLKKTAHRVDSEIAASISMNSYPGALAQVVTNLMSNSLIHAFDDDDKGLIRLSAERDGEQRVRITYSDNGKGMPEEHLRKLFDPFFTTKRGSGGSGLGMHIVFNLVMQVLGGSIQAQSTPGEGTSFVISIPLEVGEKDGDG